MELQNELKNIANAWNLELEGEPKYSATGLVVFAIQDGIPCVLKLFASGSDEKLSARVLSHYHGYGAIKVLQTSVNATLLERAIPATHLKSLSVEGQDDEATNIFCDVVTQLHSNKHIPEGFPSIADYWGKGFDHYLNSGDAQIDRPLVIDAKRVFFELAASQGQKILLHGDLHHDNILLDEKRGWLAIDPKGVIGEAEIEVSAFLKNPVGHPEIYTDENIIRNRITAISRNLNLNQERILGWSFALTVLSTIWLLETRENPNGWLLLAGKLKEML